MYIAEAESPADIAFWVMETYKPFPHIKELTIIGGGWGLKEL